jgi:uncharacterized protein with PIN domain
MKFAADKMLGRLAKWLRIIGQDVIYGPHLSGAGLIRAARPESRLILTRDRALAARSPLPCLFIRSDHFREQLTQVVESCRLDPLKEAFSRCVRCNAPLQSVGKESAQEKVPSYVYATQDRFSACPTCRRLYWPATHQERMLKELEDFARGRLPGV